MEATITLSMPEYSGVRPGDFRPGEIGCAIRHDVVLEDGAFIGAGVTTSFQAWSLAKGAPVGAGLVAAASVGEGETVFETRTKVKKLKQWRERFPKPTLF